MGNKKIMLDPGHGGKDPGASGNGLLEKDLTLKLAKMVRDYLESDYEGAEILLTRSEDRFLELSERARLANNAGVRLFVSLHINSAASSTANGFETYTHSGTRNAATAAAQNVIHRAIMKRTPFFQDRGQKKANYAVLRETVCISILTESGFIRSEKDAVTLKSKARLDLIARGHAEGIAEFIGLKKKPPAINAPTTEAQAPAGTKLHIVQVGAFSEMENAERLAQKLAEQGYKPIIKEQ